MAHNTANKAMLQHYLDYGADLNMQTNLKGNIALSAATTWRFDSANYFIDLGASIWVMDSLGRTLGSVAKEVTQVPAWAGRGPMEEERKKLLKRLQDAGFPDPAPTPAEGRVLRDKGLWPPAKQ